jgi:hypothetical protein
VLDDRLDETSEVSSLTIGQLVFVTSTRPHVAAREICKFHSTTDLVRLVRVVVQLAFGCMKLKIVTCVESIRIVGSFVIN